MPFCDSAIALAMAHELDFTSLSSEVYADLIEQAAQALGLGDVPAR